jgi:hypothetical protein
MRDCDVKCQFYQSHTESLMSESNQPKRILLGHLSAKGDCLYATAVARQIKADYPNCVLTWGIGSMCREILRGNPYVDEVWEFSMQNHGEMIQAWKAFETEVAKRYLRGDFDEVFLTQISPGNFQNYDGTVRLSIFRAYPRPITVPIAPVINLLPEEVATVSQFADLHRLAARANVILFECASNSGQSFVTPDYALEVARALVLKLPDIAVILASAIAVDSGDERIISSDVLSFRDHAELSKYCNLLVGCSSGISWLCTSDWAKPLPTIQLLLGSTSVYASMVHDFECWGQPCDRIIEMTDCSVSKLVDCIHLALTQGITEARLCYHQQIEVEFTFYLSHIRSILLESGQYEKVFLTMLNTIKRYGWQPQLEEFMLVEVLPKLQKSIQNDWLKSVELRQYKELLDQANQRIADIEASKFWKLRTAWFRLKRMIGLPTAEG